MPAGQSCLFCSDTLRHVQPGERSDAPAIEAVWIGLQHTRPTHQAAKFGRIPHEGRVSINEQNGEPSFGVSLRHAATGIDLAFILWIESLAVRDDLVGRV